MIEVIGNKVRTEILRELATGSATAAELSDRIEVAHSSVHRNLLRLEELGLVVADAEIGNRRGSTSVIWSSVPDRVLELGQAWIRYASGE